MTSAEIDGLFEETLVGDYDDELPWKAVSALRRIGTREVFDRAATWCKSGNPMERARGASVLAPALVAALNQSELDDPGVTMLTIEAADLMLDFAEARTDWSGAEYIVALRERFSF
jgi:hypothetical protein